MFLKALMEQCLSLLYSASSFSFLSRIEGSFHKSAKMNMVKRIMGRPRQEECSPQDNALGLMHLRRLFTELCHPPRHMTQKEQEEKLYMMLPVFNRVSQAIRNKCFLCLNCLLIFCIPKTFWFQHNRFSPIGILSLFPLSSHSVVLGDKLTFGDFLFLSLFLKCNPQMHVD